MESLRKPLFISCFFYAIVKRGQSEFSDPPGVCISLRRRSSWKRTAVISRITIFSIQESVLVIGTHVDNPFKDPLSFGEQTSLWALVLQNSEQFIICPGRREL